MRGIVTEPRHEFEIADVSNAPKLFDRNRLSKGDIVKICCQPEVMNVQLTNVAGELCEGFLCDTSLFSVDHGLEKGNNIRFMKKNIYAIVEKWIS